MNTALCTDSRWSSMPYPGTLAHLEQNYLTATSFGCCYLFKTCGPQQSLLAGDRMLRFLSATRGP